MKVLLARHGETEWNVGGRRQGRLDSPLTQKGKRDADRIAGLLRCESFDLVCSSPLGRARETASAVADQYGMPLIVFNDLAEVDHGDFSGLTNADIERAHPGALKERASNKYLWRYPNGESYADADARAKRALDAIGRTGATSPIIVSHAMITRMLLRRLADLATAEALAFEVPHGAVLSIDTDDKNFCWLSETT